MKIIQKGKLVNSKKQKHNHSNSKSRTPFPHLKTDSISFHFLPLRNHHTALVLSVSSLSPPLCNNGDCHEEGREDPPDSAPQAACDALETHESPPPLRPLQQRLRRLKPAHSLRILGGLRGVGANPIRDPGPVCEPPSVRRIAEQGRGGVWIPVQRRPGLALRSCLFQRDLDASREG